MLQIKLYWAVLSQVQDGKERVIALWKFCFEHGTEE